MLPTTFLIYFVFLALTLSLLRALYCYNFAGRDPSFRQRIFVRRSTALVLGFHLLYVPTALVVWCIRPAFG